jgi:hypothetical protein
VDISRGIFAAEATDMNRADAMPAIKNERM